MISISSVSAEDISQTDSSLETIDSDVITEDIQTDSSLEASNTDIIAEDNNQIDDSLETIDSDIIEEPSTGSFTDLYQAINNSEEELNIESDYKFDSSTDGDFTKGISITNSPIATYTINGNNHVIDADNKAGVFKFKNGKVIINNLKIMNANMSSIEAYNCILYTNNVSFENNRDTLYGGAIYSDGSGYFSNNDKFINNYAKKGAAIFSKDGILNINNSTFINNEEMLWGLINGYNSIMIINNTVFANMTSRYSTAIYSEGNTLYVFNSTFINLTANATAGAIGVKELENFKIDGCSFINVSSIKNGGAVYADINNEEKDSKNAVTISNSLFENCSSNFGGAYLQLGGKLTIIKSNFTNNIAEYLGGAVYTSNTGVLIGSSKFNNNTAKQLYGGAVYIDDATSIINSCEFVENKAGTYGGAIYLHDSRYEIKNSLFRENSDKAIISFFDLNESYLMDNELNGAEISLNNTSHNTIVQYEGKEIVLNPYVITNATADSAKFDLRDYKVNGVSLAGTVKNQGDNGVCWAFGATGALESAFLMQTGMLLDISENNIQGAASRYGEFGDARILQAGYANSGMNLFLAWLSVLNTSYDGYDELGKIGLPGYAIKESYHIQDVILVPPRYQVDNQKMLKEALVNYGGLTVHVLGDTVGNNYYNGQTHSLYCNSKEVYGNHFVTLVGWDDNYPKENFKIAPPKNGAWICKNSWGTEWGENGFFYVSYYDTTFALGPDSIGYIIRNTENYTGLYQYDMQFDGFFTDNGKDLTYINSYEARDDELISAVGTYFNDVGEKYTIKIFVDGTLVHSQSGSSSHRGFETVKLNKKIAVNAEHTFSVQIQTKSMPLAKYSRVHFEAGNSILYISGEKEDLAKSHYSACIKVYTVLNPNPEKIKSQYYNKNRNITIASNANGKTMTIIDANGNTVGSTIVEDGFAKFNFNLNPGKYSIITSYDYGDVAVPFEVRKTIEVVKTVKIAYLSIEELNAKFYDADGVELFDRKINSILDGKKGSLIIDNNEGMLNIDLSELAIGKHTLVLINPETLEETTTIITVVSRFSGNKNINMYYADGSTFKVRVYGDNGNPEKANKIVEITLNKKTYLIKTNSQGYAILKIPNTLKPGTYKITVEYEGQITRNTVKVKQVLKLSKVKVKKSAKKLVLKATLKQGKKALKNKKVTFKFKGKKYTAKTNKKGVAKVTIKKSVLKKLKVGKKVKYQVTYLKVTVKRTAKVKK